MGGAQVTSCSERGVGGHLDKLIKNFLLQQPTTVNSLLTDAPNSGLTRYNGHSSMHGSTSLLFVCK